LKKKTDQYDHTIEVCQSAFTQFSTDFTRLGPEVSELRSAAAGIPPLSTLKTQIVNNPLLQQLSTEFRELRTEISTLKTQILTNSVLQQLSKEFSALQTELSTLKTQIVNNPVLQQLSTEFHELRSEISTLQRGIPDLPLSDEISIRGDDFDDCDVTILLFGVCECGKSIISRQFKIVYCGGFDDIELTTINIPHSNQSYL
jgi:prefoldin subunit 5